MLNHFNCRGADPAKVQNAIIDFKINFWTTLFPVFKRTAEADSWNQKRPGHICVYSVAILVFQNQFKLMINKAQIIFDPSFTLFLCLKKCHWISLPHSPA